MSEDNGTQERIKEVRASRHYRYPHGTHVANHFLLTYS